MLTDFQKTVLNIARNAIREKLTGETMINKKQLLQKVPQLEEPGAVFVTLNKSSRLRGCIGSIQPYRTLLDDIIGNAKSAAFNDPRFDALKPEELNKIKLEVSVLSQPEPVSYQSISELKTLIKPYVDGVVLTNGFNRAVFLPQVWEQLPDFNLFFEHLCKKAGLQGNCLSSFPDIEKFNVTIFEEP